MSYANDNDDPYEREGHYVEVHTREQENQKLIWWLCGALMFVVGIILGTFI